MLPSNEAEIGPASASGWLLRKGLSEDVTLGDTQLLPQRNGGCCVYGSGMEHWQSREKESHVLQEELGLGVRPQHLMAHPSKLGGLGRVVSNQRASGSSRGRTERLRPAS